MDPVIIGLSIFVLILIIIIGSLIYYNIQAQDTCDANDTELNNRYQKVKQEKDKLLKIVHTDQDIFNYIRCLNIPRAPVCRQNNGQKMCRSMQIDCNKFRTLIERNPEAKHRLARATDQYFDSYQVKDLNGLTEPVDSGWMF